MDIQDFLRYVEMTLGYLAHLRHVALQMCLVSYS